MKVSLPVVGPEPIRKSKSGKWRAAVLIGVHLLIAAHLAHWLGTGSTMTPLEPSEAMEFTKNSIVNAGLIFFALMVLSTLILGRWFCGWACHVVALQDLARWILGKFGIRPKPARLGLLGVVPLIAFVYMFIAPAVYRSVHGIPAQSVSTHLTTSSFWATFPPWLPAVLTFLVCGFVIIYLLGSKGFCTYGCPYGAIFGVVDQLSPMRIRVTDACEGCGHCTAVCSSNVRVHQEVRDWGMVVDPGCMKCLDCVSVCPNDALYWGFGMPALLAKPRRKAKKPRPEGTRKNAGSSAREPLPHPPVAGGSVSSGVRPGARVVSWVLMLAFLFAAFTLLWWFDTGEPDWRLTAWLTAGSFIAALIFKGRSQPVHEYTTPEQVLLGVLFLLGLFLFRGLPLGPETSVPFLFSLGLSAITAYLGLQLWRFASRPNLAMHGWQLKRGGRIGPAGFAFAVVMLGVIALGVHAAFAQSERSAERYLRLGIELVNQSERQRAADMFSKALLWQPGLIEARRNLAGMHCALGRFEEGIAEYRQVLERDPDNANAHAFMARAYVNLERLDLAEEQLVRALEIAPGWEDVQRLLSEVRAARQVIEQSTLEQQVVSEIATQPLGAHTLQVLGLPGDFVERIADRIIRSTYRQNFHRVLEAAATGGSSNPADGRRSDPDTQPAGDGIHIIHSQYPDAVRAYRQSLTPMRPELRGFRAAIMDQAAAHWPMHAPAPSSSPAVLEAADAVASRLAGDGLPTTLARVIELLGPAEFVAEGASPGNIELLRQVGLPVDLLPFFSVTGQPDNDPLGIVPAVARRLAGARADELRVELQRSRFRFTASHSGFRAVTESGEHDIGLLRVQVPAQKLWSGPGAGDVPEMIEQLAGRLPEARFLASIHEPDLRPFQSCMSLLEWADLERITLLVEPMPLAQWAQDNGKAGVVDGVASIPHRPATLIPRYASQREDGSVAALNDSFLMDGLTAAGHTVVQSPLLFQGGNLLVVRDPAKAERVLLIGEAELYRNTALGLTRDQVLEAFRVEFGVDRCLVLPAVSFHIDFDVTLRSHQGRLTAFVNNPLAAARIMAGMGLDVMESDGLLDPAVAQAARTHLTAARDQEFLDLVHQRLLGRRDAQGYFPGALADRFSSGRDDPGVENFQRFLWALDVLGAMSFDPEQVSGNRHQQAYLRSFKRQEADRQELHRILTDQGWKVVGVPSLSEAEGSINYLNGLHDQKHYYLPAYGGFYAPLDQAAVRAFQAESVGAEIVPVPSRASQQRAGALRCSFAAYP